MYMPAPSGKGIYIRKIPLAHVITYTYICYSYTMDRSGLPDMYTRSTRTAGPRAEGVHIKQTTSRHGIIEMCLSHSLWYAESSSCIMYTERMEQYFVANGIDSEARKKAIF